MSRTITFLAVALALAVGCKKAAPPPSAQAPSPGAQNGEAHEGHAEEAAGSRAAEAGAHGEGDGHGHGDEASDLDQPVDALLAKVCEHGKKNFECAECRYEVGVARVPKAMIDDGLVKVAVAARRKLEAPLPLTGEIKFDERHVTHIAPSSEAMVRTVKVSLGQQVRAGDALVVLESIALGEAQSQYLESRGALELARKAAERAESLREEKIASEKEWLQARQEREAAEIRAKAAAEKLERLGLSPSEVEGLPARGGSAGRGSLVLRAPAAGMVLEMHAVPGELVRPDEAILTVGNLSDLWIWADLYEDQLGRVLEHQGKALKAGISVKAFPGVTFPGSIDFVAPTMDEKTRTVKVRVGVKNPDGKLRAGMFAAVNLYLPGDAEGLTVPRGAVLSDEGRSFVFVKLDGDYFMRRPVETGRVGLDWIEITKGLDAGKTVATDGAFLLKSDVLRSKMGAGCAD